MSTYWETVFLVVGFLQGILLVVSLLHWGKQKATSRVLAVFTLVFALGLLEPILLPYRSYRLVAWLGDLLGGTAFLYGPLLYLYTLYALEKTVARSHWWKHGGFFVLFTIVSSLVFWTNSLTSGETGDLVEVLLLAVLVAQLLIYSWWSVREIKGVHQPVRWVVLGFSTIYVLGVVGIITALLGWGYSSWMFGGVQIGAIVLIYVLSYWTLLVQGTKQAIEPDPRPNYVDSPLTHDQQLSYMEALTNLLESEQYYLQPNLTVSDVAQRLGVNRSYISQTINAETGQNFTELVNRYRIAYAKKLLKDPAMQHLTVLAIGFEAGFNSKTTFNTTFKKMTGQTPSAFRGRPVR